MSVISLQYEDAPAQPAKNASIAANAATNVRFIRSLPELFYAPTW